MHQIDLRDDLCPRFLSHYSDVPWGNWNPISDKIQLNKILSERQLGYCAYCECSVDLSQHNSYHVDHVVQRNSSPQLTYDWCNLVLSCGGSNSQRSCGRYKDVPKTKLNSALLIHPINENAREFIFFVKNKDGKAEACVHINAPCKEKAQKTIEYLNLNCEALISMRTGAYYEVSDRVSYLQAHGACEEYFDIYQEEREKLLKEVYSRPFSSSLHDYICEELP